MNNWISIKNKLPNHNEIILATTGKGYIVSVFIDTIEMNKLLKSKGFPEESVNSDERSYLFCSQERRDFALNGVTHWMPLPAPPK